MARGLGHTLTYSLSINELLVKAGSGDLTSLRHAISIDRVVIGTEVSVSAIAHAQLRRDRSFLSGLFKRIKNPHLGRRTYVDLKFMHRLLADAGAVASTSHEELLELVQGRLGLYTQRRGDPVKGLAERFRAWAKEATMRK